ncbi:cell wall/surface protein [Chitinispirillum alkaliphilum]|nr:cell wall/surface protein [Chitinispirillum alkaliphilum]
MTLYAKWQGKTYTITYNGNANTAGTVPDAQTKNHGFSQTIASNTGNLQRTGYTFVGWNTAADGEGINIAEGTAYTTDADLVLYAKWEVVEYKISYTLNEGENIGANPQKYTIYTSTITFQDPPSITGYTFQGWYEDEEFNTEITEIPEGSTGGKTLHARWTPNEYTVTFDARGGSEPSPVTKQVTFGNTYGTLANTASQRDGDEYLDWEMYIFAGWWTGQDGTGTRITADSVVTIDSSHTLYAYWYNKWAFMPGDTIPKSSIFPMSITGLVVDTLWPPLEVDGNPSWPPPESYTVENDLVSVTFSPTYWTGYDPRYSRYSGEPMDITVTPKPGVETITLPNGMQVYVLYTHKDTITGENEGYIAPTGATWMELSWLQENFPERVNSVVTNDLGRPGWGVFTPDILH